MLHIVNKSPLSNGTLDSCLRVAVSGDILLIEDAVYAATKGNSSRLKYVRRWVSARFTS